MKRLLTVSFLLLSLLIQHCNAELGIGLGYPYLSVKYNFSKRIASEIRWATGEGINVYAGRGYWNFSSSDKLKLFTGFEGGYINFDTLDMKGTGYEGAAFVGGEYFLTKKLSFALDISPTFIGIKSDEFKVDGIEFVANLSLYYYFSSPEKLQTQKLEVTTSAEKYNNSGRAKFNSGDYSGAIKDYDKAIEINSTGVTAYASRGKIKSILGDFAGAILDCGKAIELNPKCSSAYDALGYIYFEKDDFNEAEKNFIKAIEINNSGKLEASSCCGLGITYFKKGDILSADKYYKKAIIIDKRYAGKIEELVKQGYYFSNKQREAINQLVSIMGY